MAALALDHIALPIFEVEKSLQFYGELLGLPLVDALTGDDWGGKPWLMLLFGLADQRQVVLVAIEGAERESSPLPRETRHFAFAVESSAQLAEWQSKLANAGVELWEEAHETQRSVYFVDPNGIVLEITTPPSSAGAARPALPPRATVDRYLALTQARR